MKGEKRGKRGGEKKMRKKGAKIGEKKGEKYRRKKGIIVSKLDFIYQDRVIWRCSHLSKHLG